MAVIAAQSLGVVLQVILLIRKHGVDFKRIIFVDKGSMNGDKLPTSLKNPSSELFEKLKMCGILMCRTSLVMLVYSSATSLIARYGGPVMSAAHQIAFQLWLASSLLADSLAVAAQSLMAKRLAKPGGERDALEIGSLCLRYALLLGFLLTGVLQLTIPKILMRFSTNPDVLAALGTIACFVVSLQVICSIAFVLDGIVYAYGAPGFKYATVGMGYSAAAAISTMWLSYKYATVDPLRSSWLGLAALMVVRAITMLHYFIRRQSDKHSP